MALSSGATDGIRCDSAAKESAGNASTLGSQASAAEDEVIVPDAITANNEGNLAASPSYVGRMIAIRPWEMKLARVDIASGGSGYAVSDTITLSAGVAGVNGSPVLTVDAVSGGVITAVSISQADGVDIRRIGMTSAPSPADNPVAQGSTSGTGTSATFTCYWEPHFEIRKVIADSSNTLTVHEPWVVPPVSGDNWAVSYILDDYATQTGLTLRAQSGVYEATRRIRVGSSTAATARRGWLAMLDGQQLELDNVNTDAFTCDDNGCFTMGYLQGGLPANGAYISTSDNDALGAPWWLDGLFFMYDIQVRSARQALEFVVHEAVDDDERKFCHEVGNILTTGKGFDCIVDTVSQGNGARFDNFTFQGNGTRTSYIIIPPPTDTANDLAAYYDRVTLNAIDGFGVNTSQPDVYRLGVRNITLLSGAIARAADDGCTVRIVNPNYVRTYSSSGEPVYIVGDDLNSSGKFEEWVSVIVRPLDEDGAAISGVRGYIYDGQRSSDALPANNTNQSASAAYDRYDNWDDDELESYRFFNDIEQGDVAYFADVYYLTNIRIGIQTAPAGNIFAYGTTRHAFRGYVYGREPICIPFDAEVRRTIEGLDVEQLFPPDSAITEASQATALTNPTTNPTVTKHGAGETDTRPMKALNYDAGTGSVPTLGETVTQGSATGVVVDYEGDAVSGVLLLESWNGTEFTDNQNITGGTSSFDATTNLAGGTGFYEEFTWEVDAQGEALTVVYDYLAARMAQDTLVSPFEEVIAWGGNEPAATQLMFSGPTGYYTPRALRVQDTRLASTLTADFSDSFTRADETLSTSANWEDADQITTKWAVVSNEAAPGHTGAAGQGSSLVAVTTTGYTFASSGQWVRATLTTLSGDTQEWIGIAVGVDTTNDIGVALVANSNDWEIRVYHNNQEDGRGMQVDELTGISAPAANDVLEIRRIGNLCNFYINDVQVARHYFPSLDGFYQPGMLATSNNAGVPAGRLDDFEAGDLATTDLIGEGVWIHNRGAGDMAYMTADDGTQFTPQTSVALTVQVDDPDGNAIAGARVRIELTSDGSLVAQGTTNGSGTFSASYLYTSDVDVRTKVRLKGWKNFRTGGTITSSGLTVGVTLQPDDIVDLP